MSLEDKLTAWAKGPGTTEQEKCDNAERAIKDALADDKFLDELPIKPRVFVQGSYRANTNVRQDSDVDVCVLLPNRYFYDLTFSDITDEQEPGMTPSSLTYSDFRNEVEKALVQRFGRTGVTRGNKAFDVHSNSYRIDADVVTAFEMRRYGKRRADGTLPCTKGVAFIPDKGHLIQNWPDQTHENGVAKNNRTGKNYKRAIRIIKRLRNEMQDKGIAAATDIGSFLIESLVWNVPDDAFERETYTAIIRHVLAHTCNETRTDETCIEWGEVNELKYIFKGSGGLRERVNKFLNAGWDYLGYKE
jgi:Nucleotidyltransferase domain